LQPMPRLRLYCLPPTTAMSPGASRVPANIEPSMTESAPAAKALATSPEYCMPPSAIKGTPAAEATVAASIIAVICGAPTPATTRVVQIEPGPMPTLMASAPASIIALAAERVAKLPPTTSIFEPKSFCTRETTSNTRLLCACAESTTRTSTPASTSKPARSYDSSPVPMPAATSKRPEESLEEFGNCSVLTKSLTVIRPTSLLLLSTIGSFSTLLVDSSSRASSLLTPSFATTSGIEVMTSETLRE